MTGGHVCVGVVRQEDGTQIHQQREESEATQAEDDGRSSFSASMALFSLWLAAEQKGGRGLWFIQSSCAEDNVSLTCRCEEAGLKLQWVHVGRLPTFTTCVRQTWRDASVKSDSSTLLSLALLVQTKLKFQDSASTAVTNFTVIFHSTVLASNKSEHLSFTVVSYHTVIYSIYYTLHYTVTCISFGC